MSCALCTIVDETYRVVELGIRVYSIIPEAPVVEGHVMVVPRRHVLQQELNGDELMEINNMVVRLKDKLVQLYSQQHPLIVVSSDTSHASVPDHFHEHLVPSEVDLRYLMAKYYGLPAKQRGLPSDLERRAKLLRP